jgi:hypothetical protein
MTKSLPLLPLPVIPQIPLGALERKPWRRLLLRNQRHQRFLLLCGKRLLIDDTNKNKIIKAGDRGLLASATCSDCASCGDATEITVSSWVTEITDDLFASCRATWTSVTIPASVMTIGAEAFSHSMNLASVKFEGPDNKVNFNWWLCFLRLPNFILLYCANQRN